MLKFSAHNRESDRPVLGIGLSRNNCDRLLAGQPIQFTTANMPGMPPMEVFIMAGETEYEMTHKLLTAGVLSKDQILEDQSLAEVQVRPADSEVS
jgi:hypothetical protein